MLHRSVAPAIQVLCPKIGQGAVLRQLCVEGFLPFQVDLVEHALLRRLGQGAPVLQKGVRVQPRPGDIESPQAVILGVLVRIGRAEMVHMAVGKKQAVQTPVAAVHAEDCLAHLLQRRREVAVLAVNAVNEDAQRPRLHQDAGICHQLNTEFLHLKAEWVRRPLRPGWGPSDGSY